jgi:hypothetical protein
MLEWASRSLVHDGGLHSGRRRLFTLGQHACWHAAALKQHCHRTRLSDWTHRSAGPLHGRCHACQDYTCTCNLRAAAAGSTPQHTAAHQCCRWHGHWCIEVALATAMVQYREHQHCSRSRYYLCCIPPAATLHALPRAGQAGRPPEAWTCHSRETPKLTLLLVHAAKIQLWTHYIAC